MWTCSHGLLGHWLLLTFGSHLLLIQHGRGCLIVHTIRTRNINSDIHRPSQISYGRPVNLFCFLFFFAVSRLGHRPRSTTHEWPLSQANRASWGRGQTRISVRLIPGHQQPKVCKCIIVMTAGLSCHINGLEKGFSYELLLFFYRGASESSTTIGKAVSSTGDRISPSKSASLGRPSRPRTAPPNRAYSKSSRSESAHPVSDIGAFYRKDVTDAVVSSKKQPSTTTTTTPSAGI